jgi:hypothetical protein
LLLAGACTAPPSPDVQFIVFENNPVTETTFGGVACPGCERLIGATLNPDSTIAVVQSNCPDCGQCLANLRGKTILGKQFSPQIEEGDSNK